MTYHKNNVKNTHSQNKSFKSHKKDFKSPSQVNSNIITKINYNVVETNKEEKELEVEKQYIPPKTYTDQLKPITEDTLYLCVPRILNERLISKEEYETYFFYNDKMKVRRKV